ncbi:MAG: S24 family peptidase [Candidatus Marinarcus sp.]|uniref:S24 family peptidase n=1 Tax=Candidatus Marinarcus sp. TaxID=3100987 RepID=UPI003AFFFFE6
MYPVPEILDFIKCIKVENDKVILKSNNQAFDDITLHIDDVNIVGRVCGVLIKV